MKIICVVGAPGSGSNELAGYLSEQHDVPTLSASEFAREVAALQDEPPEGVTSGHYGEEKRLAERGTEHFMVQLIETLEDTKWESDALAITGIKSPADIAALREQFGPNFVLVHVTAGDQYLRYKRTRQHVDPAGPQTFHEFVEEEEELEREFHLSNAVKEADITIENSGSLEEFHEQIEARLTPLLR